MIFRLDSHLNKQQTEESEFSSYYSASWASLSHCPTIDGTIGEVKNEIRILTGLLNNLNFKPNGYQDKDVGEHVRCSTIPSLPQSKTVIVN